MRSFEELREIARIELDEEKEREIIERHKVGLRKDRDNSVKTINEEQSSGPTEEKEPLNELLNQNRDVQNATIKIVEQLRKDNNKLQAQLAERDRLLQLIAKSNDLEIAKHIANKGV